jgi:hypothetical protein
MRPEVFPCPARERLSHRFLHRSPLLRWHSQISSGLDSDSSISDSRHPPGSATDACTVLAAPGGQAGDSWGDSPVAGGTKAAAAAALDVDYSDVHLHVWLPRSALSAVRDGATSASYHSTAPGQPDCTSPRCRWVRDHPYNVLSLVATSSDRHVRGTTDDDISVSGSYYLPWAASDDHSDVIIVVISTHHRTSCFWDASSHYSTQSADVFSSSKLYYTTDTGVGSGGSLHSSCHWADPFSDRIWPRASRSLGHLGSYFGHRDEYDSTSSTSTRFLFSNLVRPVWRFRRGWRLWFSSWAFEGCLYLTAGSLHFTSEGLDTFLVLVAKGGNR